ncbi:MAG: hypothetical protein H2060_10875 [Azoarcus sp.]|nr:hypothetical protein [Azoarcus sp.]
MRLFLAFAIVLCIAGGAWLVQGHDFYWPARGDPSLALHLSGSGARLLGAALFVMAGLGAMAVLQARRGRPAGQAWQITYFALAMLVVALIGSAIWNGEVVPNPEASAPAATTR